MGYTPTPPPIARGVRPRPRVGPIVNRPARDCTIARTYLYAGRRHEACTVQCVCRQAGHVVCSSNVRTVDAARIVLRARAIIKRRPSASTPTCPQGRFCLLCGAIAPHCRGRMQSYLPTDAKRHTAVALRHREYQRLTHAVAKRARLRTTTANVQLRTRAGESSDLLL